MSRKIDPELKERIIKKIKAEGLSVKDASKEFGLSSNTIYAWIGAKGSVEPGLVEMNKLKRENAELKQIIGALTLNMERGKKIAKIRTMNGRLNKTRLAKKLGLARSTIYYRSKKRTTDEKDKLLIEAVMAANPSYGHKRIAPVLRMNKKRVLRIMIKYDLKPRIRRFKKPVKIGDRNRPIARYDNIVSKLCPLKENIAWAGDFTYIPYRNSFVYLATVIDLFTKEIIGAAVSAWHSQHLVKAALDEAVKTRNCLPKFFHSDQGAEYQAEAHADHLEKQGVIVSMSKKSSPWQNGCQESFYSQFKLELGETRNYTTTGHLAEAIYRQLYYYNHIRIHTNFKMSPSQFRRLNESRSYGQTV